MAVYERTQRESAHVYSRVVDKSQVPSALTWAALGCVTASKGELNKVYQCGTTDYLNSVFGEHSKDHISLVCASKIIADDNTMFVIRVAHENSLRGAQAIISTETNYDGKDHAVGIVEPSTMIIQLKEDDENGDNLRNIASTMSADLPVSEGDADNIFDMINDNLPAMYRDVYQIDSKGNQNVSNELCLVLSDVADLSDLENHPVLLFRKDGNTDVQIDSSKYQIENWFYGEGYAKRSVIVLSPSAGIVENRNCMVMFGVKQTAQRAYGTASPNKVVVPLIIKSAAIEPVEPVDPENVFSTPSFPGSTSWTIEP